MDDVALFREAVVRFKVLLVRAIKDERRDYQWTAGFWEGGGCNLWTDLFTWRLLTDDHGGRRYGEAGIV